LSPSGLVVVGLFIGLDRIGHFFVRLFIGHDHLVGGSTTGVVVVGGNGPFGLAQAELSGG
jgi:hypothetical protein